MRGGHKGEKFFFAFLDELDHFKHKIKSVIMTSLKYRTIMWTVDRENTRICHQIYRMKNKKLVTHLLGII